MPRQEQRAVEEHSGQVDELSRALHDLLWLIPRTLDASVERALGPLPATELEVMRLLSRRPGLGVSETAAELGLQASNASTAIRSLIARGLLDRERDETDHRRVRLVPTDRAERIRRRREAAWSDSLAAVLARLAEQDRRRLLDAGPALRALAAALSAPILEE